MAGTRADGITGGAEPKRRKARGWGEGGVRQRPDGRWEATLELGLERNTKGNLARRRKSIYGKTKQEVLQKLRTAQREMEQGKVPTPERLTVAQHLGHWLEHAIKPKRAAKTYASYAQMIRLHIEPAVGRYSVAKLTPQHVDAMLATMRAKGLSPRTIQYGRDILRSALGRALKWDLVGRNVAALVDAPRGRRQEMKPLDQAQARPLLVAVEGDRLEALYSVALALGMREWEALGLRWQDVDLEQREVHVRRSLQRSLEGKLALNDPKTEHSTRTLPLPQACVATLRQHRSQQLEERLLAGEQWEDHDFVFCTRLGRPLIARNVVHHFKAALERASLPRETRFYDLRHSCATLLRAQGVDLLVISRILGHSQLSTTADIYTHVLPPAMRDAADMMDALLAGGNETPGCEP